ncbi:NADPH-dependent FMN reductase [Saccharothrix syringae]|uniref:NADPH-dependent oxidoreductase n=1 Tax=Saccharothrix syringae TaxID=103733 RepID=A0A5Q0H651_SACSY|nr:NAD(P)H-dependent oxidoreductase [Saccharothrix syringae]QFZ21453.1 NADPH-dependent oxidoreductase [Saccharothrix syringae]
MSTPTLKLAVILGSVREGRRGPVVGRWFRQQAEQHGQFDVDYIDLAEVPLPLALPALPPLMGEPERPEGLAAVTGKLAAADAFVIVTPEYNHSYPASIKTLVDWHFTQWRAKPVAFVSYGGIGAGLRSVEHLRAVFAELHAVTVRDSVCFPQYWELFDAEGQPRDAEGANGAAKVMLDQLAWWGSALHLARETSPYPQGD